MLRPDYPVRTARLTIRPFRPTDLDAMCDIESRPEVTRYLPFRARDRSQVAAALTVKSQSTVLAVEGRSLTLAVVLTRTGALIGEIILSWRSREHRQGEIGYVFHPGHGGNGYATEAAAAALRLGFDELGLHRIVGRIDARNTASARLLERLGMRREAHFVQNEIIKDEWTDEVVYALLEDEWRAGTRCGPQSGRSGHRGGPAGAIF